MKGEDRRRTKRKWRKGERKGEKEKRKNQFGINPTAQLLICSEKREKYRAGYWREVEDLNP